jgi:nitroimidazol reductase NimA-like FMN-containing flavoprotein (pyridoxamine 5'-phosphate oxidase superfamily)
VAGVRMTEDEIWQFVADAHTGVLMTLRRDGMPIGLPIWFVCIERQLYMRTRGMKLARLRNDPRAAFLVESGDAWKDLKAVHFTGRAELITLDGDLASRYHAEVERKYASSKTARSEMPTEAANTYAAAVGGIVRFIPDERVISWDNRKLGT